jgi:hypothetical protein
VSIDTGVRATITNHRGETVDLDGSKEEVEAVLGATIREAIGAKRGATTDDVLEHMPYPIPETEAFVGTRGFLPAKDLETIAGQLIREYPQHFGFLDAYTIVWLWKGKANKRGWTKAAKDLLGHFAPDVHFIIWLGADVLREEQFTHGQVRKQVFHELLHIVQDDKGRIGVRADHDFEGYVVELEEFGPWTAELARAKRAMDEAPTPGLGPLFDALDDDDVGI